MSAADGVEARPGDGGSEPHARTASDGDNPAPADRVLVSVNCEFARASELTVRERARGVKWREYQSGEQTLTYASTVAVEAADAAERQAQFESALSSHLGRLEEAGLSGDELRANAGEVVVYISLCPQSGQAGVVFTPGMIQRLSDIPSAIVIDALC